MMVFQLFVLIVAVFLCIIIYVLFAPLLVEIDSNNYIYRFRIVPILRLEWVSNDLFGYPEMNLLGVHKKFILRDLKLKLNFRGVMAIIKTFKVKKCIVNIDTGNMPLNGKLFPMMYILSGITGKTFHINFVGKNEVVLTIKNNVFNILKAYIKNK